MLLLPGIPMPQTYATPSVTVIGHCQPVNIIIELSSQYDAIDVNTLSSRRHFTTPSDVIIARLNITPLPSRHCFFAAIIAADAAAFAAIIIDYYAFFAIMPPLSLSRQLNITGLLATPDCWASANTPLLLRSRFCVHRLFY
jgi:hypothetical protein